MSGQESNRVRGEAETGEFIQPQAYSQSPCNTFAEREKSEDLLQLEEQEVAEPREIKNSFAGGTCNFKVEREKRWNGKHEKRVYMCH